MTRFLARFAFCVAVLAAMILTGCDSGKGGSTPPKTQHGGADKPNEIAPSGGNVGLK